MNAHLAAFAVCVCGALAEGIFAGTGAGRILQACKQPPWAPSPWAWYLIGALYYVVCYVVVYRLWSQERRWPALAFFLVLMVANATWNIFFFRLRRLGLVHTFNLAYAAYALVTLGVVSFTDKTAAIFLAVYVAYLPYAVWLGREWKRLNPERQ